MFFEIAQKNAKFDAFTLQNESKGDFLNSNFLKNLI